MPSHSKNLKIVIIGANGQLGSEYSNYFNKSIPLTHKDIEITDYKTSYEVLKTISPNFVINTAAFHNVDLCEIQNEKAYNINVNGAKILTDLSNKLNFTLIHISTSYIYDGIKSTPYTEKDLPNPISWYGKTKYLAEKYIIENIDKYYIIRTVGLFGKGGCRAKGGLNFITGLMKKYKELGYVKVVGNEFITPTYTKDLSYITNSLIDFYDYGVYNIANSGMCSWYDVAYEILGNKVIKIKREENNIRPKNSSIKSINSGVKMRCWKEALKSYKKEVNL